MNAAKLADVENELHRLQRRIKDLKKVEHSSDGWYGCQQTAAVRRASLDLTKALAELRKS